MCTSIFTYPSAALFTMPLILFLYVYAMLGFLLSCWLLVDLLCIVHYIALFSLNKTEKLVKK